MNQRPHQDDIEAARRIVDAARIWEHSLTPDMVEKIIANLTGPLREARDLAYAKGREDTARIAESHTTEILTPFGYESCRSDAGQEIANDIRGSRDES